MKRTHHLVGALSASILAVAGLAACGSDDKAAASGELDKVSLRLGAILTAKEAPYFLGMKNGCFEDQGISLSLAEGKGSSSTVQTVASGADQFGQVDPATMIGLAAKGADAVAIMSYLDRSPLSVLVPEDEGISDLQGLAGRKVAYTAGDSPSTMFPAVLKVNDMPADSIEMANMNVQVKMTAILQRTVDGILGFNFMAANLSGKGLKTDALMFSDLGLELPGDVLITNGALAEKDPDLVQRFVTGSACAKKAAMEDPKAAVEAFLEENPQYPAEGAEHEFELVSELFTEPEGDEPFAALSPELMESAYSTLTEYTDTPGGKNVADYMTNEYVEEAAQ